MHRGILRLPDLSRAIFVTAVLLTAGARGQEALSRDQQLANLQSFDQVWSTVLDKYWDATFGGLDWESLRKEFRPRVQEAKTMLEARMLMREMVARLRASHFNIISPNETEDLDSKLGLAGRDGTCGIDVRVLDGQALVVRVWKGSPAETLGVRKGWRILSTNGKGFTNVFNDIHKRYDSLPSLDSELAWAVLKHLSGKVDQSVSIDFLDANDRANKVTIPFVQRTGHKYRPANMPLRYIDFESQFLRPEIGFIAFNAWFDGGYLLHEVVDAIVRFSAAEGIIIDLRGNRGGDIRLAQVLAGLVVEGRGKSLGTMMFRDRRDELLISELPRGFAGRLAILVDGLSRSTSEVFASGMRELGRARLFGSRTAGSALGSLVVPLPNGDSFQYAVSNTVTLRGQPIEGVGVTPDECVQPTRADLLAGRDPVLDAAIKWILEKR